MVREFENINSNNLQQNSYNEDIVRVDNKIKETQIEDNRFSNPQEELEYLRAKVASQERVVAHAENLENGLDDFENIRAHKKVLKDYGKNDRCIISTKI